MYDHIDILLIYIKQYMEWKGRHRMKDTDRVVGCREQTKQLQKKESVKGTKEEGKKEKNDREKEKKERREESFKDRRTERKKSRQTDKKK